MPAAVLLTIPPAAPAHSPSCSGPESDAIRPRVGAAMHANTRRRGGGVCPGTSEDPAGPGLDWPAAGAEAAAQGTRGAVALENRVAALLTVADRRC